MYGDKIAVLIVLLSVCVLVVIIVQIGLLV